ncbi:hypothetical protein IU438_20085 [Nocardia cyriacigeorgica]|uniref:hypothetical protein n=1 Tax=Nocardia cyriacigeorgica TaxID=135487 RepID=UPI00189551D5|nr:hypothetical protein [Nocardia cyriacigeorgica]MBF6398084.1 hypothetical protein [Nocardia cyriacigeorgica]MBF6404402.1 hypothetical protein [Nocardia cyriacigeorgica]
MEYLDITYRLFGEGEPADMELPALPKLEAAVTDKANQPRYMDAARMLRITAGAYEEVQQKVADKVAKTKESTKTGRENIAALMDEINLIAQQNFDDVSFLGIVEDAFKAVDGVREIAQKEIGGLGDDLYRKDMQELFAQGEADRKAQAKAIQDALAKMQSPPPVGPGMPGAPGAPGTNNPGQNPPPWVNDNGPKPPGTTPDPTRPGGINPPGTITPPDTKPPAAGVKPPVSDIKPPTTTPPISTPPRVNPPISSPTSPGLGGMPGMGMPGMGMPGMGMPGMGMGFPGMNDQLARRNELDRDLARRREELEARRDNDKPRDVVQPKPAAQPAVAQQGQGAPGTANGQPVNANSGATAAPGAGTPPPPGQAAGPVPNEKGLVEFNFPGRPPLWVSPVVHGALTAAVANKKGIDAKAAYANTPAKWSDDKTIGLRIDPSQLITGDVASWKDGTAIAVVWKNEGGAGAVPVADGAGPPAGGAEGTLEIVANGELQAVTGDIMKEDGPYGTFNGFFHPNGIDAVPPTDAGAGAPAPATADQQPTVVA